MPTEKCVAAAGGIGNINTPYYKTVQPGKKGCGIMHQREGGGKIGTHGKLPDNEWHEWSPATGVGVAVNYYGFAVPFYRDSPAPPVQIGEPDLPKGLGALVEPHDFGLQANITELFAWTTPGPPPTRNIGIQLMKRRPSSSPPPKKLSLTIHSTNPAVSHTFPLIPAYPWTVGPTMGVGSWQSLTLSEELYNKLLTIKEAMVKITQTPGP